jgi:hypothetical protein
LNSGTLGRHSRTAKTTRQTVEGEWLELIKKTGENVSWIWVTLFIPFGGVVWAWIKRGDRSKAAPVGDDTG